MSWWEPAAAPEAAQVHQDTTPVVIWLPASQAGLLCVASVSHVLIANLLSALRCSE